MAADFTRRRRFTTEIPRLDVAPGLPVGRHTFELVVEDDSGNRSRPARITVDIVAPRPFRPLPGDGPIIPVIRPPNIG